MNATRRECMPAQGGSMFPFVPAGSMLGLRPRDERPIEVGDIVCYPAANGDLVAHRVVACVRERASAGGDEPCWIVRGDAGGTQERIAERAIAWVVDQVEHRGVRYRTDGAIGRALARIAVQRGAPYLACTQFARGALRIAHVVRLARA